MRDSSTGKDTWVADPTRGIGQNGEVKRFDVTNKPVTDFYLVYRGILGLCAKNPTGEDQSPVHEMKLELTGSNE